MDIAIRAIAHFILDLRISRVEGARISGRTRFASWELSVGFAGFRRGSGVVDDCNCVLIDPGVEIIHRIPNNIFDEGKLERGFAAKHTVERVH